MSGLMRRVGSGRGATMVPASTTTRLVGGGPSSRVRRQVAGGKGTTPSPRKVRRADVGGTRGVGVVGSAVVVVARVASSVVAGATSASTVALRWKGEVDDEGAPRLLSGLWGGRSICHEPIRLPMHRRA